MGVEGLLQAAVLEPFDGLDVAAFGLDRQQQAGADRLAIDLDRARAADALLTADLGAGDAEVADEVAQERAGLDRFLVLHAIDADLHSRPASLSARRVSSVTSARPCASATPRAASWAACSAVAPSSS